MNTLHFRRTAVAVAAAAVLPLALTACSSGDSSKDSAAGSTPSAAASTSASADDSMTTDKPFGPGCASVPQDGAGSFDGMATRRSRSMTCTHRTTRLALVASAASLALLTTAC
ncbi:fasciclin domain-containing protein, partial [Streptomyces cyaneofuscatus]